MYPSLVLLLSALSFATTLSQPPKNSLKLPRDASLDPSGATHSYRLLARASGDLVPTDPSDPPFTLPQQYYLQNITCPRGTKGGSNGMALLVPGTGGRGSETYERSLYPEGLRQKGFGYCWLDLPGTGTADLQLSAEYVAFAIKYLASTSGKPVSVIGYSQGGPNVQWALTFWRSTRRHVKTFSAMAPPFRGTGTSGPLCDASEPVGGCLPALLQMSIGSRYMNAINSGEGREALVPTTVIYSLNDEIVIPQQPQSVSTLPGASNILIQDICGPLHVVDHFLFPAATSVFAVVMDAVTHGRPADPKTIDRAACADLGGTLGRGIENLPNDLRYGYRILIGSLSDRTDSFLRTLGTFRTRAEPTLQPYVCERGYATSCGRRGFRDNEKRILSNIPIVKALRGAVERRQVDLVGGL